MMTLAMNVVRGRGVTIDHAGQLAAPPKLVDLRLILGVGRTVTIDLTSGDDDAITTLGIRTPGFTTLCPLTQQQIDALAAWALNHASPDQRLILGAPGIEEDTDECATTPQ